MPRYTRYIHKQDPTQTNTKRKKNTSGKKTQDRFRLLYVRTVHTSLNVFFAGARDRKQTKNTHKTSEKKRPSKLVRTVTYYWMMTPAALCLSTVIHIECEARSSECGFSPTPTSTFPAPDRYTRALLSTVDRRNQVINLTFVVSGPACSLCLAKNRQANT